MYFYDAALDQETTREDVALAVRNLYPLASEHSIPRGETQLQEHIWASPDRKVAVRYVYAHFVDMYCVRAESDQFGEPAELIFALSQQLPLHEVDGLIAICRTSESGSTRHGWALRGLAAITGRFRADVFDLFCDALESPIPEMRGLAMKCISRWPYFQFAARLRARASREDVLVLRQEAERLADDLIAHGKRGTL